MIPSKLCEYRLTPPNHAMKADGLTTSVGIEDECESISELN